METLINFLQEHRLVFLIGHMIGTGVGLGAATVSDLLFLRFLKNFRITEGESGTLSLMSKIIWCALGAAILTGIALYLPASERLLDSSKFLIKMTVLAVLVINGIFLNFVISPKLTMIFSKPVNLQATPRYIRRITFALGSVSITSWYTVFLMGAWRGMPYSYGTVLAVYLAVLACAMCVSQVMEHRFHIATMKK